MTHFLEFLPEKYQKVFLEKLEEHMDNGMLFTLIEAFSSPREELKKKISLLFDEELTEEIYNAILKQDEASYNSYDDLTVYDPYDKLQELKPKLPFEDLNLKDLFGVNFDKKSLNHVKERANFVRKQYGTLVTCFYHGDNPVIFFADAKRRDKMDFIYTNILIKYYTTIGLLGIN